MSTYRYNVIIEQDEDGLFVASCPTLQGCYTQGETYAEALENIKDAIRLHIDARRQLGEPVPLESVLEEVEVVVYTSARQVG
ncbi:MAG: type II toxin-antitoxin system HicB family antitoxin [Dehalococcoidia bacterium]|nr:type II toxin-antitoxin system HicB family antitoxin [Dehalococcoidia bacterium]